MTAIRPTHLSPLHPTVVPRSLAGLHGSTPAAIPLARARAIQALASAAAAPTREARAALAHEAPNMLAHEALDAMTNVATGATRGSGRLADQLPNPGGAPASGATGAGRGDATHAVRGSETRPAAATPPRDTRAEIRKLSNQLEGVFVSQLFQAMRDTVSQGDGLGQPSPGEQMFTSLFDDAVANQAAEHLHNGLGDALYRQLTRGMPPETAAAPEAAAEEKR